MPKRIMGRRASRRRAPDDSVAFNPLCTRGKNVGECYYGPKPVYLYETEGLGFALGKTRRLIKVLQ